MPARVLLRHSAVHYSQSPNIEFVQPKLCFQRPHLVQPPTIKWPLGRKLFGAWIGLINLWCLFLMTIWVFAVITMEIRSSSNITSNIVRERKGRKEMSRRRWSPGQYKWCLSIPKLVL
ncbi:hypothetical protein TWF106_009044 [Orbilia oligospora]|uniref:Uncharacterized protein n=1 Tax=Orbilia oligospora TaxID=2813651 RepID=A0A7C8UNF9_ORBOL|nr:hypothetical protein TWF679_007679 [Orbilia oligospora]KAF3214352.1 hypothetical protein TWF106_009044 [Orbilia oligospora]KAF3224914.1 hypothetical protein TWF191_005766 [Orbilia oligospora]